MNRYSSNKSYSQKSKKSGNTHAHDSASKKQDDSAPKRNYIMMDYEELREQTSTNQNMAIAEYMVDRAYEICKEVQRDFRSPGRDAPGFLFEVFGYIQQAIASTPFALLELKPYPGDIGMGQEEDTIFSAPEPAGYESSLEVPYDVMIRWPNWLKHLVIWSVDPSSPVCAPFTHAQSNLRYAMLKKFEALFYNKVTSEMGVHYRFDGLLSWPKHRSNE